MFNKKLKIKKKFGQHFIKDKLIINNIIDAIKPKLLQPILEIGPGLGALTKNIIKYTKYLTVIEIDKELIFFLKKKLSLNANINFINEDILNLNLIDIYTKFSKKIRLIGNLPYNISTQILFYCFKNINFINDMHFMFQKEVADCLLAEPNTKNYNKLSIITKYFFQIKFITNVLPDVFKPKPKVHSVFLRFKPHKNAFYSLKDLSSFYYVVNLAFNQRRKMLKNSLRKIFNSKQLLDLNINTDLRAENLSIEQYCNLANAVFNLKNKSII